jgi:hypothetical protein
MLDVQVYEVFKARQSRLQAESLENYVWIKEQWQNKETLCLQCGLKLQ